jgi:YD repeat-containing protein
VQTTASTLVVGSTSYPVSQTYDDAGAVLTQTYPTGEVVTTSYTAQERFLGLTTSAGNTTLVNSASYTDIGGAAGLPNSLSLGNGANGVYTYTASYNALLQPTDTKLARVSDSAVLFEQQPTFDPVGNVASVGTTLPAGTDHQAFCYDEQDRLTWASSASGTIPCGGTNTAGTLSAASYTQSFAYDNLNRLTSGPLGSYIYGDSAHLHGATAIGGQWTGTYDASGNLTCRAPSSTTTCAIPATGAQLSYDNEGQLTAWQNAPSSPTSTDSFLYDGEGNRVEQQVTASGSTSTTVHDRNLTVFDTAGNVSTVSYCS